MRLTKKDRFYFDEFYGAPTPTMGDKLSVLQAKQAEVWTKIILGAPVSEYDKFIAEWKKLGGDQITAEVNDWYKKDAIKLRIERYGKEEDAAWSRTQPVFFSSLKEVNG
ncbi:hypothetical protein OMP38_05080 [Cohnella ginsengisoli]|uniref:Uncharacterized protein n=1 Tax=Cohnella ginsengisoli TaxID=425004 RepID=A0A9X4KEH3_9BACL|nr:hypothetical protein [Cohnella ginsengisoli]MDG0790291.1 hypothetical protein [Cohnella ginsengisoli]